MGFNVDRERELEQYCVARFSTEDKDELVKDLMSVAFTVKVAEVCARVERVIEELRSRNGARYLVDGESAKARFDRLQELFRFVDQPTIGSFKPRSHQLPPWLPFTPWPWVNVESTRTLDELQPSAVTVDGRKLYARSEVEQVIQDLTEKVLSEEKMMDTPADIPTWPALYLTSMALSQLAAVNFSDFVALIRNALPTQTVDQERRRAAILALAFGHLNLCKALLDNEEVPESQLVGSFFSTTRAALLFLQHAVLVRSEYI